MHITTTELSFAVALILQALAVAYGYGVLQARVRSLESNKAERGAWEAKIDRKIEELSNNMATVLALLTKNGGPSA